MQKLQSTLITVHSTFGTLSVSENETIRFLDDFPVTKIEAVNRTSKSDRQILAMVLYRYFAAKRFGLKKTSTF